MEFIFEHDLVDPFLILSKKWKSALVHHPRPQRLEEAGRRAFFLADPYFEALFLAMSISKMVEESNLPQYNSLFGRMEFS